MRRPSQRKSGTPTASDSLRKWPDTVGWAMCKAIEACVTEPSRITASNAASCLAYLDEKVPVRGGFPGLTPVEGTLELGPAVQPGGNSE